MAFSASLSLVRPVSSHSFRATSYNNKDIFRQRMQNQRSRFSGNIGRESASDSNASLGIGLERVNRSAGIIFDGRKGKESPLRANAAADAGGAPPAAEEFNIRRLEAYTEKVTSEVLLVHAEVDGEEDEVLIFKGYSSSIMRPTATDPSEPVLPATTKVLSVDRIRAPYNPSTVQFVEEGVKWEAFLEVLSSKGL